MPATGQAADGFASSTMSTAASTSAAAASVVPARSTGGAAVTGFGGGSVGAPAHVIRGNQRESVSRGGVRRIQPVVVSTCVAPGGCAASLSHSQPRACVCALQTIPAARTARAAARSRGIERHRCRAGARAGRLLGCARGRHGYSSSSSSAGARILCGPAAPGPVRSLLYVRHILRSAHMIGVCRPKLILPLAIRQRVCLLVPALLGVASTQQQAADQAAGRSPAVVELTVLGAGHGAQRCTHARTHPRKQLLVRARLPGAALTA